MWVLFTAYNDSEKRIKSIERFCGCAKQAELVARAFLNKCKSQGKDATFVAEEFCSYNVVAGYELMKHDADSLASYINRHPCDYAKKNDLGLRGLHEFL